MENDAASVELESSLLCYEMLVNKIPNAWALPNQTQH